MTDITVRPMTADDADRVRAIYQAGLDGGDASFETTASLALHERVGFRVIGTRERVGRHYGRWRDVVLLERRSPVI
ncbi:GNAT family N-acetyltransferase [Micromonospora chalcea]